MNYYTYAYLREDRTPYYIGKGKYRRVYQKHGKIYVPPKNRIIFLKQNLTEEEAFRHEIYMIAVFGRKDLGTGILRNMTDGGDGTSGLIPWNKGKIGIHMSEYTKMKISIANKGKKLTEKRKNDIKNNLIGNKHKAYKWKITFNDGKQVKVFGLRGWAEKNGYDGSCLIKVSKGKRSYHKDIILVELIDS
jgi:hypothetical protein